MSVSSSSLPSWTNLNFQFLSSELDYIERLANLWFAHIKHFALCRKWSLLPSGIGYDWSSSTKEVNVNKIDSVLSREVKNPKLYLDSGN